MAGKDLILNLEKKIFNYSFGNFFLNLNEPLHKHAPFKEIQKYQLKLKTKRWIIEAIHKLILVKISLFKKFIKLKDHVKITETHNKYNYYRNLLSTVIKKSKKDIMNSLKATYIIIKNTWKETRYLVTWKQSASSDIHLLSQGNETVTNPRKNANISNDYFSTIAKKNEANFRFSNKSFDQFFQRANKKCK